MRKPAFVFIFIVVALDMLALGLIVPVLPKIIVQFEGGDHARAAQVTGLFGFVWALMQFVSSPILGSLSDRYGRRPVLLLSSLGLGLDYVLIALAPNLGWLLVGRILSGITTASFSTATAYIADITPPEGRAARFGILGAAFGLGFVVGPALGGVLGHYGLRLPFWVAAGFSLANTLYGYFVLPESLAPESRTPFHWVMASPLGSWRLLSQVPLLAGAQFCAFLTHESLPSMFVLYTDYRYHWDERMVGLVLGAIGISSTVVSALLVRRSVQVLGEKGSLMLGLVFGALGFTLYGVAPTSTIFLLGVPCVALWGLAGPSLQALMSRTVDASRQGQLQGALSSMRGVAGMIGPILFTQAFALGVPTWAGAPYLLAGGLLVVSLGLAALFQVSLRARA